MSPSRRPRRRTTRTRRRRVARVQRARTTPATHMIASHFHSVLRALRENYSRLYRRFAFFSLWLGSYEQTVAILPYLITAPLLFSTDWDRRITLGKVTQLANAFGHVFDALNILSDRWVDVTDWLSVLRRLREWERHLNNEPRGPRGARAHRGGAALARETEPSGVDCTTPRGRARSVALGGTVGRCSTQPKPGRRPHDQIRSRPPSAARDMGLREEEDANLHLPAVRWAVSVSVRVWFDKQSIQKHVQSLALPAA